MEISKENISGIEALLEMTKMLCERLVKGKMKKSHLDDWEKDAIAGHKKMIWRCDITLKMLSNLKPILVIELESESLPPPSAPPSVAEPEEEERKFCDLCKKHFEGQFETICDPCHQLAEEEEAKVVLHRKLARIAELQAKKDKRSTEISQANKQTLSDLKEQVELLESIGYSKLDTKGKTSLTRFKKRIVELEAESASTGPHMLLTV